MKEPETAAVPQTQNEPLPGVLSAQHWTQIAQVCADQRKEDTISEKANSMTDRLRTQRTMLTRLSRITPVARLLCLHTSFSIGQSMAERTIAIEGTPSIGNGDSRTSSSESHLVYAGHQTMRGRMKHSILCEDDLGL